MTRRPLLGMIRGLAAPRQGLRRVLRWLARRPTADGRIPRLTIPYLHRNRVLAILAFLALAHGGVITLDMGPNWNPQAGPIGSLAADQLSQVQAIKAALK